MNSFLPKWTYVLLLAGVVLSCSKEDDDAEEPVVPKNIVITVMEDIDGVAVPVEGAIVELSQYSNYISFMASRQNHTKTTNVAGKVVFSMDEVKSYVTSSTSGTLTAWIEKKGTFLSNFYNVAEPFNFDNRNDANVSRYIRNSMTAAVMQPSKWVVKRATVNGTSGEPVSCMLDNYLSFNIDPTYGVLQLKLNDDINACSNPNPIWRDSTIRNKPEDSFMNYSSGLGFLTGSLTEFSAFSNYSKDSLQYNEIRVSIVYPDTLTFYSLIYDAHKGVNQNLSVTYYCYKVD